jgi:hypothetical protein
MARKNRAGPDSASRACDSFEAIRDALNNDPEFARATQLFDGSVLLNIGKQSIWMKWYRIYFDKIVPRGALVVPAAGVALCVAACDAS